ncbi:MAG: hypothetical protein JO316_10540 [Abitibacteriaceae bacterium]|nr:hypothetical protein [Abditibacteriaceae bacterium]MBV9865780.1 hypothetical protein [Abditibacteriaceae bacterium]
MQHERYENMADLVAQSHGLYLRLRERLGGDHGAHAVLWHAYLRYQRRLAHFVPTDLEF